MNTRQLVCSSVGLVLAVSITLPLYGYYDAIPATADARLAGTSPDSNYGTDTNIWFRTGVHALVRFDMSSLPVYGNGIEVSSARAYLYAGWRGTSPYGTVTTNVYAQTQAWQETQATWNNAQSATPWTTAPGGWGPGMASGTNVQDAAVADDFGYNSWDVTDTVQAWLDGTLPNNGLLFECTAHTNDGIKFITTDAQDTQRIPLLVIRWQYRPNITVQATARDVVREDNQHFTGKERWGEGSGGDYVTWLRFDVPALPAGHTLIAATLDVGPWNSYNTIYEPNIAARYDDFDYWGSRSYSDPGTGPDITIIPSNNEGLFAGTRQQIDITPFVMFTGEGPGQALTIRLYRTDSSGVRGGVISNPDDFTTLSLTTSPDAGSCAQNTGYGTTSD